MNLTVTLQAKSSLGAWLILKQINHFGAPNSMVGPRPGPAESNADTGLGKPRRVHRVKMGWGGPQGVPCASGLQAAPERVTEHLGGGRPLALVLEETERLCTVALHFSLPPTLLHSTSSTFTGAGNLGHDCECTAGFFLVFVCAYIMYIHNIYET